MRYALFALALVSPACTGLTTSNDEAGGAPSRGCDDRTPCAAGLTCASGACIGDRSPARPLVLRVRPRQDLALAPVEVQGIIFEASPMLALPSPIVLPARRALTGYARTTDDPPVVVSTRALARPNGALGGDGLEVAADSAQTRRGPRFTLGLTPCWPDRAGACTTLSWSVRLTPDASLFPPVEYEAVRVEDDAAEVERPFVLPGSATLPTVRGVLTRADGLPADGLLVFATDAQGRRLTTETRSDADGAFELGYWPTAAGRLATLRAVSEDLSRPLPRFASEQRLPAVDAPEDARVWDVRWPALDRTFVLVGRLTGGEAPLGGARVRFETTLDAGRFVASALVGDAGRFEVTVYPGTYRVDVEPALGSPFRLSRLRADLTPDAAQLDLVALPRNPVKGRLVDPSGRGLEGARVVADLVEVRAGFAELDRPGETPPTRVVETETLADGSFTLALDPGLQRLSFEPAASTGLPALTRTVEVPVEAGLTVLLGDVSVPPAVVLSATVQGPDGLPLSGATVEALWTSEGDQAVTRAGEAITDAEGAVVLRLSSAP